MNHPLSPENRTDGSNVSNVVFDVGNVLLRWDPGIVYRDLFSGDHERVDYFLREICSFHWNHEQDRGRDWNEATNLLLDKFPDWELPIRAYYQRWREMIPGAFEENARVLEALWKQGVPTYAITNFSSHSFRECQERFPFLKLFKGIVVSAEEKLVKPDPDIFELFFSRYDLAPESCVFIDDSAANIATAQRLGMATIHNLPDETDLKAALKVHGITVHLD